VHVEPVDERDSSWEDVDPRFRVYLFDTSRGVTSTYDITGADVLEVVEWAEREAGNSRLYAVALVHDGTQAEVGRRGLPGFSVTILSTGSIPPSPRRRSWLGWKPGGHSGHPSEAISYVAPFCRCGSLGHYVRLGEGASARITANTTQQRVAAPADHHHTPFAATRIRTTVGGSTARSFPLTPVSARAFTAHWPRLAAQLQRPRPACRLERPAHTARTPVWGRPPQNGYVRQLFGGVLGGGNSPTSASSGLRPRDPGPLCTSRSRLQSSANRG